MRELKGNQERSRANSRLMAKLVLVVVGMFGFGFAMVPLYNVFCELTGFNGKTGRIADTGIASVQHVDRHRIVTVEFVTSLNQSMDWEFRPAEHRLRIHPGKLYTTSFYARNKAARNMVGQAVPSVAPGVASLHFKKTECFCFERQPFEAGEEKQMPVSFMVDAGLPEDVNTITLSYTFFDVTETVALPVSGSL